MAFELIPVTQELWVVGKTEGDEIGDFRGSVIAIALRDTDPLSASQPGDAATAATEGLLGWGTTSWSATPSAKRRCGSRRRASRARRLARG